jgi:hypothetical protein
MMGGAQPQGQTMMPGQPQMASQQQAMASPPPQAAAVAPLWTPPLKRRRVGGPKARTCHNCGQEGHLQRECPLLRRKGQGDLITEANLRLKLPTDLAPYDRQLVVDAAVYLLNDSNKCVFGGEESTALFPALRGRCMHAKCRRRANGHTNMPTHYVFDDSVRMELFRQAGVTNWD